MTQAFYPKTLRKNVSKSAEETPSKLKVIDLFCGAGGFSKGFDMAGFKTVFGDGYYG